MINFETRTMIKEVKLEQNIRIIKYVIFMETDIYIRFYQYHKYNNNWNMTTLKTHRKKYKDENGEYFMVKGTKIYLNEFKKGE